jgi:hypothetical protein
MKNFRFTALLVVIVFATVGVPGHITAAGCDPASGCCGSSQTFVGRQIFPNSEVPSPPSVAPAPISLQSVHFTKIHRGLPMTRAMQPKATPAAVSARQGLDGSLEALDLSCGPMFGTLW